MRRARFELKGARNVYEVGQNHEARLTSSALPCRVLPFQPRKRNQQGEKKEVERYRVALVVKERKRKEKEKRKSKSDGKGRKRTKG